MDFPDIQTKEELSVMSRLVVTYIQATVASSLHSRSFIKVHIAVRRTVQSPEEVYARRVRTVPMRQELYAIKRQLKYITIKDI